MAGGNPPHQYGSMAIGMVKVTFTLDETTVDRLNVTAGRLRKPKSEVVREAIRDYHAKSDRLSPEDRRRMLRALDELSAHASPKSKRDVDRELREVRRARRARGRLHDSAG